MIAFNIVPKKLDSPHFQTTATNLTGCYEIIRPDKRTQVPSLHG